VVTAALALAGVVVGVIIYGYLARPAWIGVADKNVWDYLELLIVTAALAIGVAWINRRQSEREREADKARQKRQRAEDAALQAYLDQMSQLLTDNGRPLYRSQPNDSLSTLALPRSTKAPSMRSESCWAPPLSSS
jgi:hypothetical protein